MIFGTARTDLAPAAQCGIRQYVNVSLSNRTHRVRILKRRKTMLSYGGSPLYIKVGDITYIGGVKMIKSIDLCTRCAYGFMRYCTKRECKDCEMLTEKISPALGTCKCLTIEWNTPCPYFREVSKTDGD